MHTIQIFTVNHRLVDEFKAEATAIVGAGLVGKKAFINRNPSLTGKFVLIERDEKGRMVGKRFEFVVEEHRNLARRNLFSI